MKPQWGGGERNRGGEGVGLIVRGKGTGGDTSQSLRGKLK